MGSAWDDPTFNVTGTVSDAGIPVALTFPSSSVDCLIWAGVVAELNVNDTDGDGIPNAVEDATTPLVQPPSREFPLGQVHPNYYLMGARSNTPDAFVELGYFKTAGWGDGNVTTHDHRPDPQAVEMVARAFKNAGINLHVDVGNDATDADNRYPRGRVPSPRTARPGRSPAPSSRTITLAAASRSWNVVVFKSGRTLQIPVPEGCRWLEERLQLLPRTRGIQVIHRHRLARSCPRTTSSPA